ncbi:MAG: hypothetical protein JKY98_01510 [Gammaproteobacteria bacterium]|nr:hypothetical protein [Gammaproteobacteria bacterium]
MKTQMSFPKVTFRFTLVVLTLLLAACAQNYRVNVDAINSADIAFLSSQENLIFASGQPTQEQVGVLADAGIRHVISLRTDGELDWDESELVESLGMEFHSLPVSGRTGVTSSNAQTLEQILARLDGQPVLVHCGTSNRVGALKAVTARDGGASIEQALEQGRRWGLTGMAQRVRDQLSGNSQ